MSRSFLSASSLESRDLSVTVRKWLAALTLVLSTWVGVDYLTSPDPGRPYQPVLFISVLILFVTVAMLGLLAPVLTYRWPVLARYLSLLVPRRGSPTLAGIVLLLLILVVGMLAVLTGLDPHRPTTYLLIVPFLGALFRDMRRKIDQLEREADQTPAPDRSIEGLGKFIPQFIRARREVYGVALLMFISQVAAFYFSGGWQERGAPDIFVGVILGLVVTEVTQSAAEWILAREREVQSERQRERDALIEQTHRPIKDRVSAARIMLGRAAEYLQAQNARMVAKTLGDIDRRLDLALDAYSDVRAMLQPNPTQRSDLVPVRELSSVKEDFKSLVNVFKDLISISLKLDELDIDTKLPRMMEESLSSWAEDLLPKFRTNVRCDEVLTTG